MTGESDIREEENLTRYISLAGSATNPSRTAVFVGAVAAHLPNTTIQQKKKNFPLQPTRIRTSRTEVEASYSETCYALRPFGICVRPSGLFAR